MNQTGRKIGRLSKMVVIGKTIPSLSYWALNKTTARQEFLPKADL